MRLTCPNCSARYEVADSMIPPEGRDVQCSNCATTWFQPGRRSDADLGRSSAPAATEARPAAAVPPPADPQDAAQSLHGEGSSSDGAGDAPATEAPDPATPAAQAAPEPQPEPERELEPEPEPMPARPRRPALDPELRSILAEEAAREARLRRAEAENVETQAEMPLPQQPEDSHRARRRAELEAAPDAFDMASGVGAAAASSPSARDLFPDIEEINSTLRDTGDRSSDEADASDIDTLDTLPRRRRGTRIGFLVALALAAGASAAYVHADRLANSVPALAPVMAGYVAAVDGARFWLDDLARDLAGDGPEG